MNMPTPQTCTILAALRLWQQGLRDDTLSADLRDIACNDGAGEVLTTEEIDQLCQELNFGDLSAPAYRDFHRKVSSILRDPNGEFKELQSCADAISEISEALENAAETEIPAETKAEKEKAQKYRDAAFMRDEVQIDEDAKVSMGEDKGAYVQCWLWISDDEAQIEAAQVDEESKL